MMAHSDEVFPALELSSQSPSQEVTTLLSTCKRPTAFAIMCILFFLFAYE